jgi:CDP-glucose 4,6-dehydratase
VVELVKQTTEVKPSNPDYWSGRNVFVTGATGIVGSWLINELLAVGASVVALVRDADPQSELFRSRDIERVSVVTGALEDAGTLARAINTHEIEIVFHLGAQTIVISAQRSPLETFESNIRGTYNLLEACRLHQETISGIVIASSDKAYGENPNLPYTEDNPLRGRHPYEVSKSCADLIAQSYQHTYALPVAIARCGNIYGGGDLNWSRIVPGTIRSLLHGERPIIRSDGNYVRDYIYVKDIVHAYLCLAECLGDHQVRGQAFNFSAESPLTVISLVMTLQKLMACKHLEAQILSCAEGEIPEQHLSAAKAREMLGWMPHYSLERGLSETIDWYRSFLQG